MGTSKSRRQPAVRETFVGNSLVQSYENSTAPEWPGLSRRVLRHVIIRHDLPVGSRILDVGCGQGELVHFLHLLGFDVVGIDRSREVISTSRNRSPHLDLRHGRPDEPEITGLSPFDVVIVRDFAGYDANLLSSRSLQTTANLLSCLKPGRVLVFLARTGMSQPEFPALHSTDCYQSHLAAFPGHAESTVLPDSYVRAGTWTSLLSGRRPTGYLTATYQVPDEPQSREDWLEFAAAASRVLRPPCCQSVQAARPAA